MSKFYKLMVKRGLVMIHFSAIVAVLVLFWMKFYSFQGMEVYDALPDRVIIIAYSLILFILSNIYNCYNVGFCRVSELLYSQILANLISWGFIYIIACVMRQKLIDPLMGFAAFFIQCAVSVCWYLVMNKVYFRINKPQNTVVIYRNANDLRKLGDIRYFENKWSVSKRIQCIDLLHNHDIPNSNSEDELLFDDSNADETVENDINELIQVIKDYEAVFVSGVNATLRNGIVKYCVDTDKDCFFIPHTGDVIVSGAEHVRSFAVPICRAQRCLPSPEFLFFKRLFDIVVSGAALVILFPILLATAIIIKCYDGGPALYKQIRMTKDGRCFKILKFRSMRVDAEKDGVARLSLGDKDDRITPVGKVIRAIRFDELPQLINILKGDMSIVGPRPERPEIAEQYEKEFPAFRLRLQVKAGLTGYAQVYGRYNTEPADKLKMDLMYINNIGFSEDLRLMLATVKILFMKDSTQGVEAGQVTALGNTAVNAVDSERNTAAVR